MKITEQLRAVIDPELRRSIVELGMYEMTAKIHEQAASSTIPMETLQRAFQNIYDTMDQIDQFKLQALGNMKQTVDTLGKEVEKSKGYIARAEGVNQGKLEGATSPLMPIESK